MSKFGVPAEAQLAKINKLAKRTLSADEVFAFSGKSAGDMMIPGRYMRLSPELLKVMADDAQKGVSFMLNHNWSNRGGIQAVPYGKVFDGAIEQSAQNDETISLVLSKYIVRDNEVVDGVSADALIKKIETGILSDTSIGWGTDVMTCSICAKNYYSRDCSHWCGTKYEMGDGTQKLCTVTAMPPSIIIPYNNNALMEESIVWDGAYPGAMVTQAKHGDVVELPTGKFSIVQDKEELPEGTLFHGYYHNGDIVTMVKKSERKKVFSAVGTSEKETQGQKNGKAIKTVLDTIEEGGEKPMDEKLKKMLEAFGIENTETINFEEVCNKLAEQWEYTVEAIKASAEPLKDAEGTFSATEHLGVPVSEISAKLGKDLSGDELLNLAKEGQEYRKQLIDEAIAMGVRAQGNDFPAETWKVTFAAMGSKQIKDIMGTFENQAKDDIPTGRLSDPEAEQQEQATAPDEAYHVGR